MKLEELTSWWQSLKIAEKKRIASKIEGKPMTYPACTWTWVNLPLEEKIKVYNHCTDKHGLLLPEWQEGQGMSY